MTSIALFRRAFFPFVLLIALFLSSTAARDARAEPIPILVTGGFIEVLPGPSRIGPPELATQARVVLTGPDGFELSASGRAPGAPCDFGCEPAQQISLSVSVFLPFGTVSYRGESFPFDAFAVPGGGGNLDLISQESFTLPQASIEPVEFQSAFILESGRVFVPGFFPPSEPGGNPTPVMHQFILSMATGTVSGTFFFAQVTGLDLFRFDRIRFDVEPIPEPASLLLLGSGLGALCAVRRRRRGMV